VQRFLVVLAALFLASSLPGSEALADSGGGGGGGGISGGVDRASIDRKMAARRFERGQKHVEEAKELEARLASEQDPDEREDLEEDIEDHYDDAVGDFEWVVKKQPDSYPAFSELGFSLRKLGRFDESLKAYDRALRKKPGYAPAIEYRGEAYLELGRLDDARKAWEQLSGPEPELADLLLGKMQRWLARQQSGDTASVDPEKLTEFEKWLSERKLSDLPPRSVRAAASRW
jgi:tetratricopeptide (TPR) repeat protein